MDVSYVSDWSVWLDLVLLVRTSACVLFSRGAY
jgi:lipopolysaccharide/colanic/teichoic acid biosynthesis glycosyltransferase